jgi:hypothetical protein
VYSGVNVVFLEGRGKKWNGLRSSGMYFQNSNVESCVATVVSQVADTYVISI